MRVSIAAALVLVAFLPCAMESIALTPATLPASPRRPVTDSLHGRSVTDPYRWLEGDAKGNVTPEVATWTDAQNAYTRSALDTLPGRPELEARLRKLMTVGSISAPRMRGDRYFYSKRSGSENQASIFMRHGPKGEPRLLLDPAKIDPSGLTTISFTNPNPSGTLLAFGLYRAGDEKTTAYVLDVDKDVWLADEVPGKVDGVHWLPDSTGFVYHRLGDVKNPYSGQICYHALGTHARQDKVLFEQYKTGPLATTWGPAGGLTEDGRWLTLSYSTSTHTNDLWVVDFDRWRRTGEFVQVEIAKGLDASFGGPIVGDTMFLHTTLDAPNGQVCAVDLHQPQRNKWKVIVPQRKDVVVESVQTARGVLVIDGQRKACTVLERYELDGTPIGEIDLGGPASAHVSTEEDRTEAFISLSGFERPPVIYRVDLRDKAVALSPADVWEKIDFPVDTSAFEAQQVTYRSKDGTPVTMFLVHKKGISLDGNNPTLLNAYGGFGISTTPSFRATALPFLEDGGVLALPNLRGGGEYGDQWHLAGMLDRKQNVFDDFECAARWLIDHKYTNPHKLAIQGGSNGGLLMGAAVTQHPELYAACVCQVPLLDMLRYEKFLMARYWVSEYGSAEDAGQFSFLIKYSPYQLVKEGTQYPAMLITAGENDARVHPLHARKFTAALQEVAAQERDANPVLLWVDRSAGHGAGKPLELVLRDQVDQQAFIRWRLEMK